MSPVKDKAMRIIENLSDKATWDDIMYQFYVTQKIDKSIKSADEGKVLSHEDVRKRILGK